MTKKILLDMDGVIVDFFGGVCELFGKNKFSEYGKLNAQNGWEFYKQWGATDSDFWGMIDMKGEEFWTSLKPERWAKQFYEGLTALAPVYFCSSGAINPVAWSGKIRWIRSWLRQPRFNNVVLTAHKELLALPTNCLVDDHIENVRKFREGGGRAILFPRNWNQPISFHTVDLILEEVEQWVKG